MSGARGGDFGTFNILVAKGEAAAFHVDVLELYSARHRRGFLKAAAEELEVDERVIKSDLGKVLLKLEDIQDERIRKALEPDTAKIPEMDEAEHRAAVDFLKDPRLPDDHALGPECREPTRSSRRLGTTDIGDARYPCIDCQA